MGATFSASVLQAAGLTATGLPVPDEALGTSRKQAVTVRVSEYCYRSTIAIRFGGGIIPLSTAHRDAPRLKAGDMVDVTIELDSEPRTVKAPDDLAASLAAEWTCGRLSIPSHRRSVARASTQARLRAARNPHRGYVNSPVRHVVTLNFAQVASVDARTLSEVFCRRSGCGESGCGRVGWACVRCT